MTSLVERITFKSWLRLTAAFLPFFLLLDYSPPMTWLPALLIAGAGVGLALYLSISFVPLLRNPRALLLALALGTAYFGLWALGAALGENFAETLPTPWRWWLTALGVSALTEATILDLNKPYSPPPQST